MKIVVLGTGHGSVTKCYNTCFALEKNDEYFLVDTGGGNGIINNLKAANIEMKKIKNIFKIICINCLSYFNTKFF